MIPEISFGAPLKPADRLEKAFRATPEHLKPLRVSACWCAGTFIQRAAWLLITPIEAHKHTRAARSPL